MKQHLLFVASLSLAACAADPEPAPALSDDERAAVHAHVTEHEAGDLTPEQRQARHQQMFDDADTDDDGKLSLAEVEVVPDIGPMIVAHFDEMDTDGDGGLSHAEIAAAMAKHHGAE